MLVVKWVAARMLHWVIRFPSVGRRQKNSTAEVRERRPRHEQGAGAGRGGFLEDPGGRVYTYINIYLMYDNRAEFPA